MPKIALTGRIILVLNTHKSKITLANKVELTFHISRFKKKFYNLCFNVSGKPNCRFMFYIL